MPDFLDDRTGDVGLVEPRYLDARAKTFGYRNQDVQIKEPRHLDARIKIFCDV